MSTSKTISTSTLSLRFMQNAQRAKQQAAVDLERAKVKDEAEWEVSKEVREALGLTSSSNVRAEQTIVQENSYLPFLFPSLRNEEPSSSNEATDEIATSTKINGRRTFAKGREFYVTSSSKDGSANEESSDAGIKQEKNAAEPSDSELSKHSNAPPASNRSRIAGPLTGKRTAARLAGLERSSGVPKQKSFSDGPVLSMISEETSAAVGTDIRRMRKPNGKGKEKVPAVTELNQIAKRPAIKFEQGDKKTAASGRQKGPLSFLRPIGVDSPAESSMSGKKRKKRERELGNGEDTTGAGLELSRRKADSKATSSVPVADAHDSLGQTTKKKRIYERIKAES